MTTQKPEHLTKVNTIQHHAFHPKLGSLICRECLRIEEYHPVECQCPIAGPNHIGTRHGVIGGRAKQGNWDSCNQSTLGR